MDVSFPAPANHFIASPGPELRLPPLRRSALSRMHAEDQGTGAPVQTPGYLQTIAREDPEARAQMTASAESLSECCRGGYILTRSAVGIPGIAWRPLQFVRISATGAVTPRILACVPLRLRQLSPQIGKIFDSGNSSLAKYRDLVVPCPCLRCLVCPGERSEDNGVCACCLGSRSGGSATYILDRTNGR
jgi:hypothetical protein